MASRFLDSFTPVIGRLSERVKGIPRSFEPTTEELVAAVETMTPAQLQVVVGASVAMAVIGLEIGAQASETENNLLTTPVPSGKQIVH